MNVLIRSKSLDVALKYTSVLSKNEVRPICRPRNKDHSHIFHSANNVNGRLDLSFEQQVTPV